MKFVHDSGFFVDDNCWAPSAPYSGCQSRKTKKRNGCGGRRLRLFAGLASFFVRCSAAICLRIHATLVQGIVRTIMSHRPFGARSTSLYGGFRNNAETAARRIADSTQPCTWHANIAGVFSEI